MALLNPPTNFRITNRDTSPIRKVKLEWDAYSGPELVGFNLAGFRIYRSATPGFAAGPSTEIANEGTVSAGALLYEDSNIPAYGIYYYEIRAIGGSGYGIAVYGGASPYGSPL